MIDAIREILFPGNQPLVYTTFLAGKKLSTQWTLYGGTALEGLHQIDFLLELDPAVLGGGGPPLRQRAVLWCDERLAPVRYRTHAARAMLELEFGKENVEARLPDGSRHTVSRGNASFLLEANLIGQLALLLAVRSLTSGLVSDARVPIFLPNQLLTIPYAITAATVTESGDLRLQTSHQEEILASERGLMLEWQNPTQGLRAVREPHGVPLPQWRNDANLAPPPRRYTPPADATFTLRDVTVDAPGASIGATLTIPERSGASPAVLFVAGSGTHDRHGFAGEIDLGSHEIVDHLARHGFLGLRYDKRGAGGTQLQGGDLERGLSALVADARRCFEFLAAHPLVDRSRMFVIGHSEGSTVTMAIAASSDPPIRGVALLSPLGRAIDEVIRDQIVSRGVELTLAPEQIAAQVDDLQKLVELARSEGSWTAADVPDHLQSAARSRTWLREHLMSPPLELVTRVKCPILVCQGGKDFQLSPQKDAERLVATARAAGLDVVYAQFPNLDHLFKVADGRSTLAQYFQPERHVAPEMLNCLTDWLRTRSGSVALAQSGPG